MTELESNVIDAAIQCWKSRRPVSWGQIEHLENPSVNCSGTREIVLAEAVAKYLKENIDKF